MRTRTIGLSLLVGAAFLVAACGGGATPSPSAEPSVAPSEEPSAEPTEAPSPTPELKPLKVGVVTDVGQLEDKSFNQSSNEGALEAATATGGSHDVIVTQQISDYAQNIQTFVDQGFDVIVTVGFLIGTDTLNAAKANPNVTFIGVDQGVCVDADGNADPTFTCAGDAAKLIPNYQGIQWNEAQPGYLVGIVAASISKSGVIGAVGGTNVPAVVRYWRGYENGAKSVNPNAKVLYQETNPDPVKGFNDPATGKSIAQQFIGQGADVLFQIAGLTGQGVLEAACDANIYGIGVDVDQTLTLPNLAKCIVTSAEKKLKDNVYTAVMSVASGTFKSGTVFYDLAGDPPGVGIAPFYGFAPDPVTQEIQGKVTAAYDAMRSGTLDACKPVACTVSGQ